MQILTFSGGLSQVRRVPRRIGGFARLIIVTAFTTMVMVLCSNSLAAALIIQAVDFGGIRVRIAVGEQTGY